MTKIFTICCFVLFTFVACGDKPKSTVHEVVAPTPVVTVPVATPTADATPTVVAPVAPDMLEAEMSMDPTPVPAK